MATLNHSEVLAGSRHPIHQLEYPDATNREAGTGETTGATPKLYDIAKQADDESLWEMIDQSPLTWAQVSIGAGAPRVNSEDIVATSSTVAADPTVTTTRIETNGDSDLDDVSLADGEDDQIKIFIVSAVGNVADSVKITPVNLIGGTQITFAASPLGLGCAMQFDANVGGWVIFANNGGTIT